MASNPPGKCCTLASFHEGTPAGTHKEVYGLDTYVTGAEHKNKRVIVVLTDIYGHKLNNTLLVADEFAKCGYTVYIPDILKNDPVEKEGADLSVWFPNHTSEITRPIVDGFLKALRDQVGHKTFVAGVGYCFGAKYVIQNLAEDGLVDAGAIAHPSLVTIEEVAAIRKPIIISAAEVDPIFTTELRHATEAKLAEIKAKYELTLFSGVSHGFAVRGDLSDPQIKYARGKALADQLTFFEALQ